MSTSDKGGCVALPRIDGEPDPQFLCPHPDEAAENYTTEGGEEISVYEAQVAANGNEGFVGEDGFPFCCACGDALANHTRPGQCAPRWGSCNLPSGHSGGHSQDGPFKDRPKVATDRGQGGPR